MRTASASVARSVSRRKIPPKPGPKVTAKKEPGVKGLELTAWEKGCVICNKQWKVYHVPGGRYYDSMKTSSRAVFFKSAQKPLTYFCAASM